MTRKDHPMPPMSRRALLGAALLLPLGAAAHEFRAGELMIDHPWTRAAGANGTGAGFLTIRNTGTQPDRLVSASSSIARRVELHTHIRDGEVMRMRQVADIPVPPGDSVVLRPGGLHIMLIGLNAAMPVGASIPLSLRFERAGAVEVTLTVEAAGARGPGGH